MTLSGIWTKVTPKTMENLRELYDIVNSECGDNSHHIEVHSSLLLDEHIRDEDILMVVAEWKERDSPFLFRNTPSHEDIDEILSRYRVFSDRYQQVSAMLDAVYPVYPHSKKKESATGTEACDEP